jgi:hypothetical protein
MGAPVAIVAVHYDEQGEISFHVFGGDEVRLFIVDERAPNDRVYEWTQREPVAGFRDLVPEGCEIGHSEDDRHAAIAHVVESYVSGKRHLRAISNDGEIAA